MNQVLRWGFTPSDLIELIEEAEMTLKELARVPLPTRKLFRIILTRSHKYTYGGQYTDREVSIPELQQATNLSDSDFGGCISILDKA